jgi:hypothetical protein
MRNEGSVHILSRRHGLLAFLRQKQWWSFEGLDPAIACTPRYTSLMCLWVDYVAPAVMLY